MDEIVLIIDDEEDLREYLCRRLIKEGIPCESANDTVSGIVFVRKKRYSIILIDYRLPEMTGLDFFEKMKAEGIVGDTLVILMTGYGSVETGLEAIRAGCYDYITKPFNDDDLLFRLKRGFEVIKLKQTIETLAKIDTSAQYGIIGASQEIHKVLQTIRNIGPRDVTVLIEGETGTGKEMIAKAIHAESPRKDRVFMPINCGAIPENLLESELFGYEKGAFTGASSRKFGLLETADQGTVFLDEVNAMPPTTQVKLLRFIETGEFIKVGGNQLLHSDVRLIAASNQSLKELVDQKKFREDLFFRLNIIHITVPPLSSRKEDIPLLIPHFLSFFNTRYDRDIKMQENVIHALSEQKWDGNVRQLKNLVHNLVLMNTTGTITIRDLPEEMHSSGERTQGLRPFKDMKDEVIRNFERKYFEKLVRASSGNVLKASKTAKIDRKHLISKLKEYGIEAGSYKKKSS